MLKFISFGSGSSGNCYYLYSEGQGVLIDVGIGVRALKRHFLNYGCSLQEVKAILVTHDHADHAKAVGALAAALRIPVYALPDVFMGMDRNRFVRKTPEASQRRMVTPEEPFEVGPARVTAFRVPHDSADCCGYLLEVGTLSLCIATDVGQVTDTLARYVAQARWVVMESNYDAAMLQAGRYPPFLKARIAGGRGHIENVLAADFLATTLRRDVQHVWLCHLSEENNRPELAVGATTAALTRAGFTVGGEGVVVEALPRTRPSRMYELPTKENE
jgi:phosphoribosyl 1,2-cyclic phosphodiesterase